MDHRKELGHERERNLLNNTFVTKQHSIIHDTFHQVPNGNPEMSERNIDIDRYKSQSSCGSAIDPYMEESGHVQELQNSNVEMKSRHLDTENKGYGKDLDSTTGRRS